MNPNEIESAYPELLRTYLFEENKEAALHQAHQLSLECFEANISLDEIISLHARSFEEILSSLPPTYPQDKKQELELKSSNLLLEFSVRFGRVCQGYFEKLQRTDERIRNAFYQTGEALTAGLDIQKMLPIILDIAKKLTDAEACAIMLYNAERTVTKVTEGFDTENEIFPDFLFEKVTKKRKVDSVYDLREKKSSILLKDGRELHSVLAVPLTFRDKILGVLGIYFTSPHHPEEREIDLLTSFANEAASAIHNAYLFSELQRHDKTLETLYAIATAVGQSLDLQIIFRDALAKTLEVTETDAGGLYLLEEDGETLHLKRHLGVSDEFAGAISTIKVGQGVSGLAVKMGKPMTLDVSKYPSPEFLPHLIKEGIVSIASVPLLAKGKAVGALTLAYRKQCLFSQDDLDLLTSIGNQIGVAIENSQLFSDLNQHHKMLQVLYSIESVVSRSLNLKDIFETALGKAVEVTGTEAGTLYSFDGEVLRLEAFQGLSPEFKEKALVRMMGEGIPGIAAQEKKAITMDISEFPSPLLRPFVEKEGLISFIGAPLMSKGKVVGAMGLGTTKKRLFTQDDLDLLFSIGNVIGIAVENARLYQESKENLEKLEQAYEELQTLDKMKDEFISNVSHELKTPLVSIRGYGELLYDGKLGELSDEQKSSLEAIIRNADRLTRLINSILFISKLQAGKIEFQFAPLDVDDLVNICVKDFNSMMEKKKITFNKDIQEISKVMGDKDRFIEVISNLLDNAVKFTPEGGEISVKARDENRSVHVVVSDNGIGISPEIIPKLFTRFYQVDASTARKYGGTGLGLYIAKHIIDAFHGRIWIDSEVGKGTTVHILLPAARDERNEASW